MRPNHKRRYALTIVILSLLGCGTAHAQGIGLGTPCARGQFALRGYLLVCSDASTFRYALPEDIPAVPKDGYVERPSWYPRLAEVFRTTNPPRCPTAGRITFTSPPIRVQDLLTTVPQGMMTGDHVTPIDHGYLGVKPLAKPRADRTDADFVPVSAPADAEVIEISLLGSPTSIRVVLAHGCDTYSVFMVINRLSGALGYLQNELLAKQSLAPFVKLLAGEEFAEQRDNPVDFSVHDGASWLPGFVAPFSYAEGEAWKPYTVDPWRSFAPDLEEAYQATMQRLGAPRWGRIDQDIADTASGNWFLDGTLGYSGRSVDAFRSATTTLNGGPVDGKNSYSWSHLAFARHWVQPGQWLLSIGWWKDDRGDPVQWLIDLASNQPDPSQLAPSSGVVVYRLRNWMTSPAPPTDGGPLAIGYELIPATTVGVAAVQVNADGTLTIELMPGVEDPSSFRSFSEAKRTYRR
jgi:hypothetical protein